MCPSLCLCVEGCCCNFAAVSASRNLIMEKYQLSSDPCDFALIRCTNMLLCLSCMCSVLTVTGLPFISEATWWVKRCMDVFLLMIFVCIYTHAVKSIFLSFLLCILSLHYNYDITSLSFFPSLLHVLADLMYFTVSGCMTAQVDCTFYSIDALDLYFSCNTCFEVTRTVLEHHFLYPIYSCYFLSFIFQH